MAVVWREQSIHTLITWKFAFSNQPNCSKAMSEIECFDMEDADEVEGACLIDVLELQRQLASTEGELESVGQ